MRQASIRLNPQQVSILVDALQHLMALTLFGWIDGWIDGWMTWNFTSFSTVFQTYQDDERVILKSCGQWNPIYV